MLASSTHYNTKRLERQAQKRRKIIGLIRAWSSLHNDCPPRVADWRNVKGTDWPSYLTVIRAFGSWDAAIEAAGFQARGRGRPIEI